VASASQKSDSDTESQGIADSRSRDVVPNSDQEEIREEAKKIASSSSRINEKKEPENMNRAGSSKSFLVSAESESSSSDDDELRPEANCRLAILGASYNSDSDSDEDEDGANFDGANFETSQNTVVEKIPLDKSPEKSASQSSLKKLAKPGPYSRTVDGPSGSRRGSSQEVPVDSSSDSESEILANLSGRMARRLNSLKEQKTQDISAIKPTKKPGSKYTLEELNKLRSCPKLTQAPKVVVSYMPKTLMREIRLGHGHIKVTDEINKEYQKSRAR